MFAGASAFGRGGYRLVSGGFRIRALGFMPASSAHLVLGVAFQIFVVRVPFSRLSFQACWVRLCLMTHGLRADRVSFHTGAVLF